MRERIDRDHLAGMPLRGSLDLSLRMHRGKAPAGAGAVDQADDRGAKIVCGGTSNRAVREGARPAQLCPGPARCNGETPCKRPAPGCQAGAAGSGSGRGLPERRASGG
jgi:hypothetical protein